MRYSLASKHYTLRGVFVSGRGVWCDSSAHSGALDCTSGVFAIRFQGNITGIWSYCIRCGASHAPETLSNFASMYEVRAKLGLLCACAKCCEGKRSVGSWRRCNINCLAIIRYRYLSASIMGVTIPEFVFWVSPPKTCSFVSQTVNWCFGVRVGLLAPSHGTKLEAKKKSNSNTTC